MVSSSAWSDHSDRTLLFTDARGDVVFTDSNLIRLINRFGVRAIIREPFHRVLGIDLNLAVNLLQNISHDGAVQERSLDLRNVVGEVVPVVFSALATYDDRRGFVGADVTLLPAGEKAGLSHKTQELHTPRLDGDQVEALRAYFLAIVETLRRLVARIGGNGLAATFSRILVETARGRLRPMTQATTSALARSMLRSIER